MATVNTSVVDGVVNNNKDSTQLIEIDHEILENSQKENITTSKMSNSVNDQEIKPTTKDVETTGDASTISHGSALDSTSSPKSASAIGVQQTANITQKSKEKSPKLINEIENRYYKNFLNPMLADMAKHAKKNEDILDQINKKLDDEREERRKERLSTHIPPVLKGHGKKMADIVHDLEAMIVCDRYETEVPNAEIEGARLIKLDEHSEAAVLSHSLAAHIQTLDTGHLQRITEKVTNDCDEWLAKLFRFKEGRLIYHDHEWDGVVTICRLALHQRYPKYATEGFEALYSRPPVVYISAASHNGYGHYICAQLGLPLSCLTVVPCNTVFGSNHKMDVAVFEKLVQDDIAAAKTPVLLIAHAGTPVVGHVDKLERLQEICEKNSIWLHVEGSHLATLTMFSVPSSVSPAKSGDSMTVNLSPWFGVAGLPIATLYKQVDPALTQSVGLDVFNPSLRLSCLPLWVCLQSLGHEGIVERVKHSCDLAKLMFEKLCEIPSVKQVSKEKKEKKDDKEVSISSLISKAIHAMIIFEIVSPTVVFRFTKPVTETSETKVAHYSLTEDDQREAEATKIYYDALNAWLCEGLCADNPAVCLSVVDVDREGICIRFAPLESAQAYGTTVTDIGEFIDSFKRHIAILQTTVNHRVIFREMVAQNPRLQCIDKPNWAGLGIIQYIPEDAGDSNTINAELVQKLKNADTAFSLGETDGNACVRFGLICEGTNISDLIAMVTHLGAEIEEASKYLEKMTDVILKGIDETKRELMIEAENKLRTEGVLRQVPLVGAFVNWWSPPPKDVMIGRSFNIQSGEIRSTQTTYKYHMQIQELGAQTPPDTDTPATPTLNADASLVIDQSSPPSSSISPFAQMDVPTDQSEEQT